MSDYWSYDSSLDSLIHKSYYPAITERVWDLVRETHYEGQILACSLICSMLMYSNRLAPRPLMRRGVMINIVNQTHRPKYSKNEVTEMAFKMARYLEDISLEKPGATMAYDIFIEGAQNAKRKYLEVYLLLFNPNTTPSSPVAHGKYVACNAAHENLPNVVECNIVQVCNCVQSVDPEIL